MIETEISCTAVNESERIGDAFEIAAHIDDTLPNGMCNVFGGRMIFQDLRAIIEEALVMTLVEFGKRSIVSPDESAYDDGLRTFGAVHPE